MEYGSGFRLFDCARFLNDNGLTRSDLSRSAHGPRIVICSYQVRFNEVSTTEMVASPQVVIIWARTASGQKSEPIMLAKCGRDNREGPAGPLSHRHGIVLILASSRFGGGGGN